MAMIAVLASLFVGNLLNLVIARQAHTDGSSRAPRRTIGDWFPVSGAVQRRDWVALTVELITATVAAALSSRYGWTPRALFLFVASLVLIDTGAVDFRIRMIDTLIMVVAI